MSKNVLFNFTARIRLIFHLRATPSVAKNMKSDYNAKRKTKRKCEREKQRAFARESKKLRAKN